MNINVKRARTKQEEKKTKNQLILFEEKSIRVHVILVTIEREIQWIIFEVIISFLFLFPLSLNLTTPTTGNTHKNIELSILALVVVSNFQCTKYHKLPDALT